MDVTVQDLTLGRRIAPFTEKLLRHQRD